MSHPHTSVRRAAAVLCGAALLVPFCFEEAAAQSWQVPRTPDGQPDLQGYWTNASFTPLERPEELGNKAFYTDEELDALIERSVARGFDQTEPGTTADVHYDLSQFGLTRGQDGFVRNRRTSLIVDPPTGRIPAMTPQGEARQAARAEARRRNPPTDRVQNMGLPARCIIWGADPPMLPIGYNSHLQIVQSADYVMILVEMMQDTRIIPLDGRPHLPENIRQWKGSSVGHWEGDTLVVETTNLTDKTAFRGASENLRVIERFTRVADDTILYQFTVDDPSTWVRPWSGEVPMTRSEGPIFEYACHEHNYGVRNTLAGARAEEAAERARQQSATE
ncbi:MAG TPA: hypothetical protein VF329_01255 [Gammaproteobacteria bacterium]